MRCATPSSLPSGRINSGYGRYWLAEHHGTPGLACNSPEVMIGPVAQATSRIRVGSGGVMLPHYSPLKVAENFSMLSALFPGRIDLGIGRAPGTSAQIAFALQRDRRQAFARRLPRADGRAAGLLRQRASGAAFPESGSLAARVVAAERECGRPSWGCRTCSPTSSIPAGLRSRHTIASISARPPRSPNRRVSVAVWALCAETDEEALRISSSARMMLLNLFRGRLIAVPSVEKAMAYLAQEGVPVGSVPEGRRIITGSPGPRARTHRRSRGRVRRG